MSENDTRQTVLGFILSIPMVTFHPVDKVYYHPRVSSADWQSDKRAQYWNKTIEALYDFFDIPVGLQFDQCEQYVSEDHRGQKDMNSDFREMQNASDILLLLARGDARHDSSFSTE